VQTLHLLAQPHVANYPGQQQDNGKIIRNFCNLTGLFSWCCAWKYTIPAIHAAIRGSAGAMPADAGQCRLLMRIPCAPDHVAQPLNLCFKCFVFAKVYSNPSAFAFCTLPLKFSFSCLLNWTHRECLLHWHLCLHYLSRSIVSIFCRQQWRRQNDALARKIGLQGLGGWKWHGNGFPINDALARILNTANHELGK